MAINYDQVGVSKDLLQSPGMDGLFLAFGQLVLWHGCGDGLGNAYKTGWCYRCHRLFLASTPKDGHVVMSLRCPGEIHEVETKLQVAVLWE